MLQREERIHPLAMWKWQKREETNAVPWLAAAAAGGEQNHLRKGTCSSARIR